MPKKLTSTEIKNEAARLGFLLCGISQAGFLEKEAAHLESYLKENRQGKMAYLENHFDMRLDPRKLVDGAKSVISVLLNYFQPPEIVQCEGAPKISKYAWGEDYHLVLKRKLNLLLDFIRTHSGEINARVFTDSAPVMDKAWAKKSGLGWIGKNTNLIHPKTGSWFFIGEIILDLELEADGPMQDFCGTCTRCIDACPTSALEPYQIDSKKCISYLTIELKDNMPDEFKDKTNGWAYGCDICQEVCPWNSFAVAYSGEDFKPLTPMLAYTKSKWLEIEKSEFKMITKTSAMSRIKWEKWMIT